MTDAQRREQATVDLIEQSERLRKQLEAAASRLDDFVVELQREARRRRVEGAT